MSQFHNPYHFAPLQSVGKGQPAGPGSVSLTDFDKPPPDTTSHLTHDRWTKGALSGRITCRLTTVTPMILGGKQKPGEQGVTCVHPCCRPDVEDEPMIPASSLRGLLSSLAEAASHSALRVADDRHFSHRRNMKEGLSAMGMVLHGAAEGEWRLLVLSVPHMANDHGDDLRDAIPKGNYSEAMFKGVPFKIYFGSKPKIRQSAFLENYTSWTEENQQFWAVPREHVWPKRKPAWNSGPPTFLGQETDVPPVRWDDLSEEAQKAHVPGILRVLGAYDHSKPRKEGMGTRKHELFFPLRPEELEHCKTDPSLTWPILPEAVDRFHNLADERAAAANDEKTPAPDRIPFTPHGQRRLPEGLRLEKETPPTTYRLKSGDIVFFRPSEDGQAIGEISLSSIWRGRAEHEENQDQEQDKEPETARRTKAATRLSDFLAAISPDLLPAGDSRKQRLTMAELLFGFAEDKGCRALAGRVFPSDALADEGQTRLLSPDWINLQMLSSPKPPSPALYFKWREKPDQAGRKGAGSPSGGHIAKSALGKEAHTIQGRKFYLHARKAAEKTRASDPSWTMHRENLDALQSVRLRARPVNAGKSFTFTIGFENLSPDELGLLCYALRPASAFRHKLGLGKPLGLGTVEITPLAIDYIDRRSRYRSLQPAAARHAASWRDPAGPSPAPETPACPPELAFPSLRDSFRTLISQWFPQLPAAMELLGNPERVTEEVHYPQTDGSSAGDPWFELDRYTWFVENDSTQRRRPGQYLPPLVLENGQVAKTMPALYRGQSDRPPPPGYNPGPSRPGGGSPRPSSPLSGAGSHASASSRPETPQAGRKYSFKAGKPDRDSRIIWETEIGGKKYTGVFDLSKFLRSAYLLRFPAGISQELEIQKLPQKPGEHLILKLPPDAT